VTYTVSGHGVLGLLRYAEARGVDTAGILDGVGHDAGALANADARVDHDANEAVWNEVVRRAADPDFGVHFAEAADLDTFHLVGHLVAHCRTLHEMLDRVARFSRILHDAGRVELELDGDVARVYPGCRGLPHVVPRHIAEFSAASVVVLARRLTGRPLVPIEVRFRHPPPASTAALRRVFGLEPTFDAQSNVVCLQREALTLPISRHREAVGDWLRSYAEEVLERLPPVDESLVDAVARLLAGEPDHATLTASAAARRLAMHPRTLQRRLAEAGTSFVAELERHRARRAREMLAEGRLSVGEIAFALGYSEPSTFHRAFRRWTGTTPAEFRREAPAAKRAPTS
jgi:AraC-like DNA-binding protein